MSVFQFFLVQSESLRVKLSAFNRANFFGEEELDLSNKISRKENAFLSSELDQIEVEIKRLERKESVLNQVKNTLFLLFLTSILILLWLW